MLKRIATMVLAAALVLGALPLAAVVPVAPAMADQMPASPHMPCKNLPPCCADGLGCAVSAVLPLPDAPSMAAPRLYSPSPLPVAALSGFAVEPELFPPIRSL